jgi:hypothetical protein
VAPRGALFRGLSAGAAGRGFRASGRGLGAAGTRGRLVRLRSARLGARAGPDQCGSGCGGERSDALPAGDPGLGPGAVRVARLSPLVRATGRAPVGGRAHRRLHRHGGRLRRGRNKFQPRTDASAVAGRTLAGRYPSGHGALLPLPERAPAGPSPPCRHATGCRHRTAGRGVFPLFPAGSARLPAVRLDRGGGAAGAPGARHLRPGEPVLARCNS